MRGRVLPLVLVFAAAFVLAAGEEARKPPAFKPFKPVLNAGEVLDYNVYWKGLKVGYMKFVCGPKPKEGESGTLTFVSKSNRLGKWFFRFFYSRFTSKQDPDTGECLSFTRHMVREERFLEEEVSFDYERMTLKEYIRRDRRGRKMRRDRLIETRMLDPLLMLYHLRAVTVERTGEERRFHLFADGFWDAVMKVKGKGRRKFGELGERDYWEIDLKVPRPWICFQTGGYRLETDRETGIILEMRWDSGKGRCKAALVGTKNSPLVMEAAQGREPEGR